MKTTHPTKARIVQRALKIASARGMQGVTIGAVAQAAKVSKSGLFSHFKSKQSMQIEILDAARDLFGTNVLALANTAPEGIARLRAMFEGWLGWARKNGLPGACPFVVAASEVSNLPAPVRRHLIDVQDRWLESLAGQVGVAVRLGELARTVVPRQFTFQLLGIYLAHHWHSLLKTDPDVNARAMAAFEDLIRSGSLRRAAA